jgi:hypothetical protein
MVPSLQSVPGKRDPWAPIPHVLRIAREVTTQARGVDDQTYAFLDALVTQPLLVLATHPQPAAQDRPRVTGGGDTGSEPGHALHHRVLSARHPFRRGPTRADRTHVLVNASQFPSQFTLVRCRADVCDPLVFAAFPEGMHAGVRRIGDLKSGRSAVRSPAPGLATERRTVARDLRRGRSLAPPEASARIRHSYSLSAVVGRSQPELGRETEQPGPQRFRGSEPVLAEAPGFEPGMGDKPKPH